MNAARLLLIATLLAFTGCAGLSVPFLRMQPDYSKVPEAELRTLAHEIESAVQRGEREPRFNPDPAIVVDTPEIQQAIRTRAARADLVDELLTSGFAYEQKAGTIAIVRSRDYKRATSRQQRDHHALVVMSENADRWTLYESMVKASNWPGKALSAVQSIFFDVRCEMMTPGQRHEDEQGNIVVR